MKAKAIACMKNPNLNVPETFTQANRRDLRRLYQHYLASSRDPFFVDLSGPWPLMPRSQFIEHCEDDSALWLAESSGAIHGFIMFSFIQSGMASAYLDLCFFDACPAPGSKRARYWKAALRIASQSLGVSHLQLVVMDSESEKIKLAESWHFEKEGVLRKHFFALGCLHNLLMLGLRIHANRKTP